MTWPSMAATKERSWVMETIVVPRVTASRKMPTSSSHVVRSCPKVGSSSTTTSGAQIRAVATDSRRFSPPDSVMGLARATSSRARRRKNRSTWVAVSSAGVPAARGPSSSSSRTVRDTNWYSGSWNTIETRPSNSRDDQAWGSVRPGAGARSSATRTCPAS